MGRRTRARPGDTVGQDRWPEDSAEAADASFPYVVTALSTLAAVALFFTGTVPALKEQQLLREVETERRELHDRLWQDLDADASRRMALAIDLQSLIAELDRHGVYAGDLLDPPATAPPGESPHGAPR